MKPSREHAAALFPWSHLRPAPCACPATAPGPAPPSPPSSSTPAAPLAPGCPLLTSAAATDSDLHHHPSSSPSGPPASACLAPPQPPAALLTSPYSAPAAVLSSAATAALCALGPVRPGIGPGCSAPGSTSAPPFSSASPGRRPPVRHFLHRLRPETAVFSLAGQPAYPDPVSLLDRDNSDPLFGSADDDVYDREDNNPLSPAFPEFEAAVDAAIVDPVGAMLHKLNWSTPKDATFMSADTTICCTCFAEVTMLLYSSDYVAHDLVCAHPSCQDFVRA